MEQERPEQRWIRSLEETTGGGKTWLRSRYWLARSHERQRLAEAVEGLPPLDTINTEERSGFEDCRQAVLDLLTPAT